MPISSTSPYARGIQAARRRAASLFFIASSITRGRIYFAYKPMRSLLEKAASVDAFARLRNESGFVDRFAELFFRDLTILVDNGSQILLKAHVGSLDSVGADQSLLHYNDARAARHSLDLDLGRDLFR